MFRPLCLSGFFAGIAAVFLSIPATAQSSPELASSELASPQASDRPDLSPATNSGISFRRPLRIVNIFTPNNLERRRSEYHFTLDFPADAVEPLQKIVFEQIGGADYPRYRNSGNRAFDSTNRTSLSLSTVENDRDQRTIVVEFDPPVEPGRQVTVILEARNPRDGIYTYQLTAFPVGATEGQYAGVERLNIYEPVRRDRFDWL